MKGSARSDRGFSLIETAVAFLILGIAAALAMGGYGRILPQLRADSAEQVLLTRLRSVRDTALTQRVNYKVTFSGAATFQEYRLQNGAQRVTTVTLPYGMQFIVFPSLPDTPDGFGNNAAIDLNGGNTTSLIFCGDGSIVDLAGNPVNGSIFIGQPGNSSTARAVTLLGTTGRVRGYRYDGTTFQ